MCVCTAKTNVIAFKRALLVVPKNRFFKTVIENMYFVFKNSFTQYIINRNNY